MKIHIKHNDKLAVELTRNQALAFLNAVKPLRERTQHVKDDYDVIFSVNDNERIVLYDGRGKEVADLFLWKDETTICVEL